MNEETKKEITLDDLALMVGKGFNDVNEKMDKQFKEVDKQFREVRSDIQRLDTGLKSLDAELKEVKSDTEDIKAELIKKVDKFTHKDLEYRVEKLEKKFA